MKEADSARGREWVPGREGRTEAFVRVGGVVK